MSDCRDLLSNVLPFTNQEREFFDRLNDHGDIAPELVTRDERLRHVIHTHPGLLWKALNVRRQRGTNTGHEDGDEVG